MSTDNKCRRLWDANPKGGEEAPHWRTAAYNTRHTNGSRLRVHYHTLIGFVFGFLVAFAMMLLYGDNMRLTEQLERRNTATELYQTGYMAALQEVATNSSASAEESAVWLQQNVRVLCMVLTCPEYHKLRAVHVKATWGKRCTKLVFISSESNDELGAVGLDELDDTYHSLWNKTREGFRFVAEHYLNEYDWFLKADDDTFVIMENLRLMLYGYDPEMPIYFGHLMVRYNVEYMSGGAGYVLSRAALSRFMSESFHNHSICPRAHRFGAEDFYMGICLQNAGVYLADSRSSLVADDKPKFFPLNLMNFMEPNTNDTISDWLIAMTPHKIEMGANCCSNYSIAFHYTDPQKMYTYEFLIYQLQAYGLRKPQLALPQKMSTKELEQRFKRTFNSEIVDLDAKEFPDNF